LSQPTTLIHGSTQAILLAIDPDENFIDVKSIAVAEIEAIVEPNGVGNDVWRESVALVCIVAEFVSQTKLI
jgi:hypothetical protein